MRIKAEAKVVTFGDLKAAVQGFEEQGFRDTDVINPPSKYLPPEHPDTKEGMHKLLLGLSRAMGDTEKHLGFVLWMCREVPSQVLPGE